MARTVLITGTSSGIGRACADRMASEGWTVFAGVRTDSAADHLKRTVSGDVRPVLLDVTDGEQISQLARDLEIELAGRGLDGLVNNAGVAVGGPLEGLSDEDWRSHFDVNLFGLVNLTRACFPLLRAARGRVVNVGSASGRASAPFLGPYGAAKHAVEAFTESLRFEVDGFGMKVICVEPGQVKIAIWAKADDQVAEMHRRFDAEMLARYDRHLDMMYGFVAAGPVKGARAESVAAAVRHALTAARPKHRYLVGSDAKMTGIVARLPDRIRYTMLNSQVNQWARSGRKIRSR